MFSSTLGRFFDNKDKIEYPLSKRDAVSGEELMKFVPEERRYRIGPFYCDSTPHSHKGRYEHAIDFLVKDGALVYAVQSGTVIDVVESNEKYGEDPECAKYLNYVTIDHGGRYSQYAHLKKGSPTSYGIYKGKKVVRGQVIGVVGKSGWMDFGENSDHLHFMLFRDVGQSFESLPAHFESPRS